MNKNEIEKAINNLSEETRKLIRFDSDKIYINTPCYQLAHLKVCSSILLLHIFFILLIILIYSKSLPFDVCYLILFGVCFFSFIFIAFISIVRVIDYKGKSIFTELKLFDIALLNIKNKSKENLIGVANNIIPIGMRRNNQQDYINAETGHVHRHLVSLLIDDETINDIIEVDTSNDGYYDSVKLVQLISEILEINSFIIEDKYKLKSVLKDDNYIIDKEEITKDQKVDNFLNLALIILSSTFIISVFMYCYPKYAIFVIASIYFLSVTLISLWVAVDSWLSL